MRTGRKRKDRSRKRGLGTLKRRRLQRRVLAQSTNVYGDIDLRTPLPEGLVHVHKWELRSVRIERLPFPTVRAVIGLRESRGNWYPEIDGIVIADLDALLLTKLIKNDLSPAEVRDRLNRNTRIDISGGLPNGMVHIRGKRLQPIAQQHGIDFATAVLGWTQSYRGRRKAITDGILVHANDADTLKRAIQEHEDRISPAVRERRRQAAEKRAEKKTQEFALATRRRYPSIPEGEEFVVAKHATQPGSGRVGLSTTALDPVRLAVSAHVRWTRTDYAEIRRTLRDRFPASPDDQIKTQARCAVRGKVAAILTSWERCPAAVARPESVSTKALAESVRGRAPGSQFGQS